VETTITGILASREQATEVVRQIEAAGVPHAAIAQITKDTPNRHAILGKETADLARGIYLGGIVGGIGGVVAGAAMTTLVPSFPLSPVTGALVFGVLGAIAGGGIGVLVGSATGHQVQEEYEHMLEHGGVLVAVNTDRVHATRVYDLLHAAGASALSTSVHMRHTTVQSA
jgi:hypothetical protein